MWQNMGTNSSRLAPPVEVVLGSGRAKPSLHHYISLFSLCLLLPQSTSFRRNFSSPLLVHEPPPACATSKESPPTGTCPGPCSQTSRWHCPFLVLPSFLFLDALVLNVGSSYSFVHSSLIQQFIENLLSLRETQRDSTEEGEIELGVVLHAGTQKAEGGG